MENTFEWTIPWVAFSKHTFKGTPEDYVEFLKDLEEQLVNIPEIFSYVNDPKDQSAMPRLIKANRIMKELMTIPGVNEKFVEIKNRKAS